MNYVLTILAIIRALPEIIEAVEELFKKLFPGEKKGAEKLEMAKEMLLAVDDGVEKMWPKIKKIVDMLVNLYNASGFFDTKTKTGE